MCLELLMKERKPASFLALSLTLALAGTVSLCVGQASSESPAAGDGCMAGGCHSGVTSAVFVHQPLSEGKCIQCHPLRGDGGPVPEYHRGKVRAALDAALGVAACAKCHKPMPPFHAKGASGTFAPADRDLCLHCHDPHGGDSEAELRGTERELCGFCHEHVLADPEPRPRPKSKTGEKKSGKKVDEKSDDDQEKPQVYEHRPLEQGRCTPCHPAHAPKAEAMFIAPLPPPDYAEYDRKLYAACLNDACHAAEMIEQQPAGEATRFRNGEDNLHYRHVVLRRPGRSCRMCHLPHRALNPALIREEIPFGKETLAVGFVASDDGGGCTPTCHLSVEYDRREAIPSAMKIVEPAPNADSSRGPLP